MGCWYIIRNHWNENWKTSNWDTTTGLNGTSWEIEEEQLNERNGKCQFAKGELMYGRGNM